MIKLIKIEELGMFLFSIFLFSQLDIPWWWFPALILLPDVGILGYLINNRAGAYLYNFFHLKALAIVIYLIGIYLNDTSIQLAGIIMFGHSSMDRMFGYGLKYEDSFFNTHLGFIGKRK